MVTYATTLPLEIFTQRNFVAEFILVSRLTIITYQRSTQFPHPMPHVTSQLLSLLVSSICSWWGWVSATEHDQHRRRQRNSHQSSIDEVRDAMNWYGGKQDEENTTDVRDGTHHTRQLTAHIIISCCSHTINGGSLAQLVATLVRSTKLLYAGPG